ncbi:MAG: SH3 domain-containing protein [Microgenomates group bacterium]
MKLLKLKIASVFFLFVFGILFSLISPSSIQATSVSVTGKAKVLNTANSYLDFTNYNANVTINNANGNFSGYAFLEDMGWVAFGTTDNSLGPVNANLTSGAVTGRAKVLNTNAYLDFTSYNSNVVVTIPGGVFSGSVFSEDMGWLDFTDTGVSTGTTFDTTAPSISLTALSTDPNSDSTPSLSGTATESVGTVSSVQFQMDATSGTWTSCIADDGSFNSASEAFTCTVSTALSDGSHTMNVRATDSNANTTANASVAADTFTIDATAPTSFDLDGPGNNSYTSSERPSFKWKATTDATAGLSKYVLEIDNPSLGTGQPAGDFTVDDIPTSRTTDYETNKYLIHYENFSDSDSTNNYISVYTKSSSEWSTDSNSGQNDGKLREGKVSWKVRARDNAGNEASSSRILFVDRTAPGVAVTQINQTPFTSNSFATTDKTPTVYGKITDSLSGGDSSQTQDENGPKVASGPKSVEIKIEKKEGLTYKVHTLYTINLDKPWYACDGKEVSDNSKQKCDKYLPFEYTPEGTLDFGTYKITLTGKDKADNSASETSFTLNITTLARIITPEEKETIEKEIKELPKEEQEKVKEELEITKPTEPQEPGVVEKVTSKATRTIADVYWKIVDGVKALASAGGRLGNQIAHVWNNYQKFTAKTNERTLALVKQAVNQTGKAIILAYNNLLAQKVPQIGNTGKFIAQTGQSAGKAIKTITQNIAGGVGSLTKPIAETIKTTVAVTGQIAGRIVGPPIQKVTTFLTITAEYWFDREPTKIILVRVEKVNPTVAVIYWQTNHHATSAVNYGFNTSYGKKVQSDERVKEHRLTLTDLEPGKTYFFEVMSQNKNYVYDAYYTFQTPASESGTEKVKGATTDKAAFKKPQIEIIGNIGSWVLVRASASKQAEVVAKVQVGQFFPLIEEEDGWWKIQIDEVSGWIFGELGKLSDHPNF